MYAIRSYYERMAEQKSAFFRTHEKVRNQSAAVVARIFDQVTQRIEREALAEHGGRLHRLLVGRREPVEARVHQRLDRPGQARLAGFVGIEHRITSYNVCYTKLLRTLFAIRVWTRVSAPC